MEYYIVKDDFYYASKSIKPISLVKGELLTKREYEKLEIFNGKEKFTAKVFDTIDISKHKTYKSFGCRFIICDF